MEEQFEKVEIFDTPEQLAASMQADAQTTTTEEAPQQESQPVSEEPIQEQPPVETQPEVDTVLEYMSERLGRDIIDFNDLVTPQEQKPLDERVAAIAEFVEKTGRNPEDWFRYQSLNPSDMDDLTAVRVDMASKYPNLSTQEVNLLIKNNYNFRNCNLK